MGAKIRILDPPVLLYEMENGIGIISTVIVADVEAEEVCDEPIAKGPKNSGERI